MLSSSSVKLELEATILFGQKQPPGGALKKGVLKNLSKFTVQHLYQSLFLPYIIPAT